MFHKNGLQMVLLLKIRNYNNTKIYIYLNNKNKYTHEIHF